MRLMFWNIMFPQQLLFFCSSHEVKLDKTMQLITLEKMQLFIRLLQNADTGDSFQHRLNKHLLTENVAISTITCSFNPFINKYININLRFALLELLSESLCYKIHQNWACNSSLFEIWISCLLGPLITLKYCLWSPPQTLWNSRMLLEQH